jgi:hypothetical protein
MKPIKRRKEKTMAEDNLNWDSLDLPAEPLTEQDIDDAESMGKVAPGRYLCTCEESNPKERKGNDYNFFVAALKWRVDKAFEVNGVAIPSEKQDNYEGSFIWDDVRLEHTMEKEGWRKRRILIAKRCGLIDANSDELNPRIWKDIVGKQAILTVEDQEYEKEGQKKVARGRVTFSGYDYPSQKNVGATDKFDDI